MTPRILAGWDCCLLRWKGWRGGAYERNEELCFHTQTEAKVRTYLGGCWMHPLELRGEEVYRVALLDEMESLGREKWKRRKNKSSGYSHFRTWKRKVLGNRN